jgi:uncharacterized protein
MTYIWATVLVLVNSIGLVLAVLGLPGHWLMVLATLLVAWCAPQPASAAPLFGHPVLYTICGLALASEVFEFIAGTVGSKAAGATRRGATGALIGAILGGILGTVLIPIPVFGSLIGTCAGAAIGAWGLELTGGRAMRPAVVAGVGAGVGRFVGALIKLLAAVAIWLLVTIAAFWP